MEDGKKPFLAVLRSSADSSAKPLSTGTVSRSSSSSRSALASGGVDAGIRKPVKYQLDGRVQPRRRSPAYRWPAQGPTRSRFTAWTRRLRAVSESAGGSGPSSTESGPPSWKPPSGRCSGGIGPDIDSRFSGVVRSLDHTMYQRSLPAAAISSLRSKVPALSPSSRSGVTSTTR